MDPIIDAFVGVVDSFVDRQVFGTHTWGEVLLVLFGIAFLLLGYNFLFGNKKDGPDENFMVPGHCPHCNWQGRVSRHRRICPKCRKLVDIT